MCANCACFYSGYRVAIVWLSCGFRVAYVWFTRGSLMARVLRARVTAGLFLNTFPGAHCFASSGFNPAPLGGLSVEGLGVQGSLVAIKASERLAARCAFVHRTIGYIVPSAARLPQVR